MLLTQHEWEDSKVVNHPNSGGTVPTLPLWLHFLYYRLCRESSMWLCSSHNMESGGHACTVMIIKDVAMSRYQLRPEVTVLT